jgi:rhamnulokinase
VTERTAFVAVDLGAESGRVMVGELREGRVDLTPLHRFPNVPVRLPDGLHWDVPYLYTEILAGLRAAASAYGESVVAVGVDSWGLDYGLVDAGGRLLGLPYHYRDARTDGMREEVARLISPPEQYARTGIAQLPINTLYQLAAQRKADDRTLELAENLLMIPDLLHYWLTGRRTAEYTNASTTGALGVDRGWDTDLLARLDLPAKIFLPPKPPGTVLGPLRPAVQEETGLRAARAILPGTHDTASAVAAVPATPHDAGHAYISSGTWSLLGLELDRPILGEEARLAGFTNEGGVGGTYRFLTNIMGLWLLQECRRSWARQGREWGYEELTAGAASAPSPGVILDVDDPAFLHPDDMPAAIAEYLRRTGQPAVERPEALARAIVEGLALAYRVAVERAERLAGTRVDTIHVVGGGARNGLLCQLTADACRRLVVAGPVEATALGNVLVQAMGTGRVKDLAEAHAIAGRSGDLIRYEPRETGDWDDRAARFRTMMAAASSPADLQPSRTAREAEERT